jgi:hypothetical protein
LYTSTTQDCLHDIIQQLQTYAGKRSSHPLWQDPIQERLEHILKQIIETQTLSKLKR